MKAISIYIVYLLAVTLCVIDLGPRDPCDFTDINPSDITESTTIQEIYQFAKKSNDQICADTHIQEPIGVISKKKYHYRLMIALPTRVRSQNCPITRLINYHVNPSSPITVLSRKTLIELYEDCGEKYYGSFNYILINQRKNYVDQSSGCVQNVNILGMDYLTKNNVNLNINCWECRGSFKMKFDTSPDSSEEF